MLIDIIRATKSIGWTPPPPKLFFVPAESKSRLVLQTTAFCQRVPHTGFALCSDHNLCLYRRLAYLRLDLRLFKMDPRVVSKSSRLFRMTGWCSCLTERIVVLSCTIWWWGRFLFECDCLNKTEEIYLFSCVSLSFKIQLGIQSISVKPITLYGSEGMTELVGPTISRLVSDGIPLGPGCPMSPCE